MDLDHFGLKAPKQRPVTPRRFYTLGCDLGQSVDPTALGLITRIEEGTGEWTIDSDKVSWEKKSIRYELNRVKRLPLGVPYPGIVAEVANSMNRVRELGDATLVVDQTGVGRPVVDLFRAAGLSPIGITFTAGLEATNPHHDEWHVPKLELVRRLEAGLHAGELKIAGKQPEADVLRNELADFRGRYTAAGNFTVSHRIGAHDDLLFATAIAFWWASRPRYEMRMVKLTGF